MFLGSYHQAFGPTLAVLAVIALGLMSRAIFGSGHGPRPGAAPREGYGLLTPVASAGSRAGADELRARLLTAGLRATVGEGPDGRSQLLVFPDDLGRAREVLSQVG